MRIARVSCDHEIFYALVEGETLRRLAQAPFDRIEPDGRSYPLAAARLLAPCLPSKVVCVGKNYRDHIAEAADGSTAIPESPILFLKPSTAVIGPEEAIVRPACSARVDYEGELGVVIGKRAKNLAPGTAKDYILGYTCLNDVTARDLQRHDGQWTRGKGFDTFCPLGPWIETDLDAENAAICTRVNGEERQRSNTRLMLHSLDELLCVMSECMTLLPGDVVATGTPAGIGPLCAGDTVEVDIAGLGVLKNGVRD